MQECIFIGLDVHKATISVVVAHGERGGEVRGWGTIANRPDHVRRLSEKLVSDGRRLNFCYEAGPCGYGLHRQLTELGHDCVVVAPSLIPVKAGDRVKTDRRDGLMLAKLRRARRAGRSPIDVGWRRSGSSIRPSRSCSRITFTR